MWHKSEVLDYTSRRSILLALAVELVDVPSGRWLLLYFNNLNELREVQSMVRLAAYEAGWYADYQKSTWDSITLFESESTAKKNEDGSWTYILKIHHKINPSKARRVRKNNAETTDTYS